MYLSSIHATYIIYIAYLLGGVAIGTFILNKPNKLRLLIIFSIIFACGMEFEGYPVIDEYLIFILFFGFFIRFHFINKQNFIIKKNLFPLTLHSKIFYLLIGYLIFQSFRGMLLLEDIRMLRWILFFLVLGYLSFIFSKGENIVDKKKVIKVVFLSSFLYFIVYLSLGYFFQNYSDINRWDLQGTLWTGTSVMGVPLILYIVSSICYIETSRSKLSLFIILVSSAVVYYCMLFYESRSSEFLILGSIVCYMLFNLFRLRTKSLIFSIFFLGGCFLLSSLWLGSYDLSTQKIVKLIPFNFQTNEFSIPKKIHINLGVQQSSNSDIDRVVHHMSAFDSIKNESLFIKTFGFGWYKGARYEMIDDALLLRTKYGLSTDHLTNGRPLQATAAAAILVDTGLFGVFLFLTNMFLTTVSILRSKDTFKYIISLIYLIMIPILFIGNVTPMLLAWVLIMPNNPIILMLNDE